MGTQQMEVVDVPVASPQHAIARQAQAPGVAALALMSDQEFGQKLAALKKGRDRVATIQRELMNAEEDYGVIPGTNSKPTLLKPGAEKLCEVYGLRAGFVETTHHGDGLTEPHIRIRMKCELHLGTLDGPVIAEGYGAANSWERKHRYRRGERACPMCGKTGTVIKGKEEYGGGFLCWGKKDGCNAKFADNDERITEQVVGDIQNDDPYDLENTLLKMAEKRAFIDATLRATATSGLFTQDVEDMGGYEPPAPRTTRTAPPREDENGIPIDANGRPLAPEAERVAAAGAEPNPGYDPEAKPASRPARPAPSSGALPPCTHCGKADRVMVSKRPDQSSHYCRACGKGFGQPARRTA